MLQNLNKKKMTKIKISNSEIIQVLDFATNELYKYFEKDINPRLKNSSFECQLKGDKKRQSDLLAWFDEIRKSLENK